MLPPISPEIAKPRYPARGPFSATGSPNTPRAFRMSAIARNDVAPYDRNGYQFVVCIVHLVSKTPNPRRHMQIQSQEGTLHQHDHYPFPLDRLSLFNRRYAWVARHT